MKKTDLAMIILIATVSVMVAFFVTKSIVGTPDSEPVKVLTIDPIDSEVTPPDPEIFNKDAINPAVKIEISDSSTTSNDGP